MNEDTIVLGIIGLVAVYLLVNRNGTGGGGTGNPLPATPGGPPVVVPVNPVTPGNPGFVQVWEQIPGGSPGAYRPTLVDTANPGYGSAENDATLMGINRMIDASNAAGDWARSSALAAQRDAWLRNMGY
jgi:hypothetical protein